MAIILDGTVGIETPSMDVKGEITEAVFAITGTSPAISPTNGTVQTWTLTANSVPTAGAWLTGESLTILIDDASAFSINWTSIPVTWVNGVQPVLATTGFTVIELWKVGSAIYGSLVGNV